MIPNFRLTQPAIRDIEEIADYIACQPGFDRADSFLRKLDAKFANISQFPNLGRQRNEILPSLRSFPIDSYLILYVPIGVDIEILRFVSGYQNLSGLFKDI